MATGAHNLSLIEGVLFHAMEARLQERILHGTLTFLGALTHTLFRLP